MTTMTGTMTMTTMSMTTTCSWNYVKGIIIGDEVEGGSGVGGGGGRTVSRRPRNANSELP